MAIKTPHEWEAQFITQPANLSGTYKVVCTHPHHQTREFYLTIEQFQDNIRSLLVPYWINNYTIVLHPCD